MHWTIPVDLFHGGRAITDSLAKWLRSGDEIDLVYVDDTPALGDFVRSPHLGEQMKRERRGILNKHRRALDELADHLRNGLIDVVVRPVHIENAPTVEGILEQASGSDGLIVATHGRTGFQRAWLGSVAEKLVRLADKPVLVLRLRE